jgi:hypothetical protein
MIISYIVDIIFVITTGMAVVIMFKNYDKNYEDHQVLTNLLIGSICLMISFFIYLFCDIFGCYTSQLSFSLHIFDTLIFFVQCRGVIILNNIFYKEKNINQSITGIFFMTFIMIIISSVGMFISPYYSLLENKGLYGLQIIGIRSLDAYFELIHAVFCFLIFSFIPFIKKLYLLKMGFVAIGISEIIQILNIMSFKYGSTTLFIIEWITAIIGIICINLSFLILEKKKTNKSYFI